MFQLLRLFGFLLFALFFLLGCQALDVEKTIADNHPYVLLVSIDGYRYDYTEKFSPEHLKNFATEGLRAESLIPVFPTLTFPNHYSIITGLRPTQHRLISNDFFHPGRKKSFSLGDRGAVKDPIWYGGDPIWRVASAQEMISAAFFWVGSEANLPGQGPTYFHDYNGKVPLSDRVNEVIRWFKLPLEKRPHFVTLYFSDVDSAAHEYGAESDQVRLAVKRVDQHLGELFSELKKLNLELYTIVLSDHGMADIDLKKIIFLSDLVSLEGFTVSGSGAFVMLYSSDAKLLANTYRSLKMKAKNFSVFRKESLPERFHMAPIEEVGALVLVAKFPYYFVTKPRKEVDLGKMMKAAHGWEPNSPSMHGIFYMQGPGINKGQTMTAFENIHVYSVILDLLGLKSPNKGEGSGEPLRKMLSFKK